MNRKQIAYILKYSHPKQLYIVTFKNDLLRLICPFKVVLKNDVGLLGEGMTVWVEEVKVTSDLVTVFIIDKKSYYFYHFDIIID